uniref:Ribose-5-phosphate isomerase n=1 Tax=Rhabditophanes sp. KR3021 TaxID=114890 RepID=A0AC35TU88_9BILA
MSRPEHSGPPELFYNETEAGKYNKNTHILEIQSEMTDRAIDLLELPDGFRGYILDIGCGSGISGEVLTEREHDWIGIDVAESMLRLAVTDRQVEGDLIHRDAGHGMPFRAGVFDGAISISAIQWLCHANATNEKPRKRLVRFFQSLYGSMTRGSKAVFQYYPESDAQADLIKGAALKAGFAGGTVVDFPDSPRKKKFYLVLNTGGTQSLPRALNEGDEQDEDVDQCDFIGSRTFEIGNRKRKIVKGSKDYIQAKKERMRRQGKEVREDIDDDSSIQTHSNHSSSNSSLSSSTFGMEAGKDAAARACALKHIKNGSRIGVGSGSTVKYFVNYLKEKVEAGELKDIECVPTSFLTRKWLLDANLPTKTPDTLSSLDVCVDGADEVDSSLNCIKGGGGCLTQEKIVQASAVKFYIIADSTKQANFLGERWTTIPLEMVPFGYVPAINRIHKELGGRCELRMAHKKCGPVITDNNGYIVDWHFPQSYCNKEHDWKKTNDILINIPGVVETGLFLNVADEVFFATNEGTVNHISK